MLADQYMTTMIDIMTPVLEKSMLIACEYCKACGRDTITSQDVEYAMKFCAMNKVGEDIGSLFPDIYSDNSDDEDSIEEVDEDECIPFTRYSGDDPMVLKINEAYDRWDEWVPQSPAEEMLKNAVNSNGPGGMDE
tara:strand:- start:136 stop:540 length:405 start_codon:yes stop_codon:yes gene_type:complete